MKGKVQVIDGVYPATIDEAVYISGTNKTLKEVLADYHPISLPFAENIIKIANKSENIFNKLDVEEYAYYDDKRQGQKFFDGFYSCSNKMKIKENTVYNYSGTSNAILCFFDENDVFISGTRTTTFTTPSKAHYMYFSLRTQDLNNAMIVHGSVCPSEYIECIPTDIYELEKYAFKFKMNKDVNTESLTDELKEKLLGDTERFENALPKVPLHLETYYEGANEPYHPSVVKFDNAWNGYRYWMAYTPFPDEFNENPCVCASNDLIKWETPNGLINPIDDVPSNNNLKYWSDTHLVYNDSLNRLEVYYRGDYTDNIKRIVRKTSTNGVNWSDKESVFDNNSETNVSPSIIYENGKYTMWFCVPFHKYESDNGLHWTKVADCSYFPRIPLWHQDIVKTDVGYELVGMEGSGTNKRVVHYTSQDGVNWIGGQEIVKVLDNNKYGIKGFYKPCIVKENGLYYLFLSVNWSNGTNGISLSIANRLNDITSVQGINQGYIPYMAKYTRKGKSGFEGQQIFDTSLNKMIYCKKGGRNAIWVDFMGVQV